MSSQTKTQELTKLHQWIDALPPRQFTLVYQLVEELVGSDRDDTAYLMSSEGMKERLLAARDNNEGVPIQVVREKLGI